eukprot:CFRG4694T1
MICDLFHDAAEIDQVEILHDMKIKCDVANTSVTFSLSTDENAAKDRTRQIHEKERIKLLSSVASATAGLVKAAEDSGGSTISQTQTDFEVLAATCEAILLHGLKESMLQMVANTSPYLRLWNIIELLGESHTETGGLVASVMSSLTHGTTGYKRSVSQTKGLAVQPQTSAHLRGREKVMVGMFIRLCIIHHLMHSLIMFMVRERVLVAEFYESWAVVNRGDEIDICLDLLRSCNVVMYSLDAADQVLADKRFHPTKVAEGVEAKPLGQSEVLSRFAKFGVRQRRLLFGTSGVCAHVDAGGKLYGAMGYLSLMVENNHKVLAWTPFQPFYEPLIDMDSNQPKRVKIPISFTKPARPTTADSPSTHFNAIRRRRLPSRSGISQSDSKDNSTNAYALTGINTSTTPQDTVSFQPESPEKLKSHDISKINMTSRTANSHKVQLGGIDLPSRTRSSTIPRTGSITEGLIPVRSFRIEVRNIKFLGYHRDVDGLYLHQHLSVNSAEQKLGKRTIKSLAKSPRNDNAEVDIGRSVRTSLTRQTNLSPREDTSTVTPARTRHVKGDHDSIASMCSTNPVKEKGELIISSASHTTAHTKLTQRKCVSCENDKAVNGSVSVSEGMDDGPSGASVGVVAGAAMSMCGHKVEGVRTCSGEWRCMPASSQISTQLDRGYLRVQPKPEYDTDDPLPVLHFHNGNLDAFLSALKQYASKKSPGLTTEGGSDNSPQGTPKDSPPCKQLSSPHITRQSAKQEIRGAIDWLRSTASKAINAVVTEIEADRSQTKARNKAESIQRLLEQRTFSEVDRSNEEVFSARLEAAKLLYSDQERSEFPRLSHVTENVYEGGVTLSALGLRMNSREVIPEQTFRELVYFNGIAPAARGTVWRFLLGLYPFESNEDDRKKILNAKREEYWGLKGRWLCDGGSALDEDERESLQTEKEMIEKDVVRTDRKSSFLKGENNPNLAIMVEILVTYILYMPELGYVQGMSDLLAPLLQILENEADGFWCFVGYMEKMKSLYTIGNDVGIPQSILYLRQLLDVYDPDLHRFLEQQQVVGMFFTYRWFLLNFKREFDADAAIKLWEITWSEHLTPYFNIFIALAILISYREALLSGHLFGNDILEFVSQLANIMDSDEILSLAKAYAGYSLQSSSMPPVLKSSLFPMLAVQLQSEPLDGMDPRDILS